jgi:hypothetical protein
MEEPKDVSIFPVWLKQPKGSKIGLKHQLRCFAAALHVHRNCPVKILAYTKALDPITDHIHRSSSLLVLVVVAFLVLPC